MAECSRQQIYNQKKQMINNSVSICEAEGYDLRSLELKSRDTGECETLTVTTQAVCENKDASIMTSDCKLHTSLYVKDKFSVSNQAYHELTMISDLPNFSQVRTLTKSLNSQFLIFNCPNNIIGVQQSLRERILKRLTCFIHKDTEEGTNIPNTIRIILTADGTKIATGLNVVNIAFTIIDEGRKAQSAVRNYSVAIMQIEETYMLAAGLQYICSEARDLEVITIEDKVYIIKFFLGGDLKFLALACGIEAANSVYACVWCKCPKQMQSDMEKE